MEEHSTKTDADGTALFAGDAWFDPIEAGIRERVRGFIEELIGQELEAALGRGRYERDAATPKGYRNGTRERQLLGSFGPVAISVPRARMAAEGGGTQEWRSAALPRYARMTKQVEALIAGAYLAGTNTRRVKRALAALFKGAVGKDVVSRTWRKVKVDWDAWIDGRGGWIGNNGNVVEVVGRTDAGLRLRDKDGRVGDVEWRRLSDPKTGLLLLGFGDALTIDAAQGITSGEHIAAFPRGTAGVTGFKAYVAESRAKGATWTVIAEGALHEAVKRSRALGDASPVTEGDLWERAAADLAHKPYKPLGVDLIRKSRDYLAEAVDAFIRQSHRFQAMEAEGRDPGREVRKQVQARAADRAVARNGTALGGMLRQSGVALREAGHEAASLERGGRVRVFVRQLGEPRQSGEHSGDEVRRLVQAEAGRRAIAPHGSRLDGAIQRNADVLRGLGQDIDTHRRGARARAEEVGSGVEEAALKPSSSPSPGM